MIPPQQGVNQFPTHTSPDGSTGFLLPSHQSPYSTLPPIGPIEGHNWYLFNSQHMHVYGTSLLPYRIEARLGTVTK